MNHLPPDRITRPLATILRRVRRLQWARGLLAVATIALAALLATMAADFFLAPLPAAVRWALWSAFVVLTLWGALTFLWRPLSGHPGLVRVARWLEGKHPELQERLSTVLELADNPQGGSESLLAELAAAAGADAEGLDPAVEVHDRKVKTWLWPAIALLVAMVVLFTGWPREAGRLLVRAVAPFASVGNAGAVAFRIVPGDIEAMEGDAVSIQAFYDGPPGRLVIVCSLDDGRTLREELAPGGRSGSTTEFTYHLPVARHGFRYHFEAGRSQSDSHRVTVWPLPRLGHATASYTYPAYTGLAPARRDALPEVKAVAGTRVAVEGTPNTPVASGRFLVDGREAGTVTVAPGADGGRVRVDLTLERGLAGLGQVLLTHRLGREVEALRVPVQALPDEPPVVTILSPAVREFEVQPDEELTIGYEVVEEIGLQGAEVELAANQRSLDPLPLDLPGRIPGGKVPRWRGQAVVLVAAILQKMPEAGQVDLRLRVKDTCPPDLGGPGVGLSETIVLRIRRDAQSLVRQEIEASTRDARQTTDRALEALWDARNRIDSVRDEVRKPEIEEHARKRMEEARERLAQAQESLADLAQRLDNNIHAAKADEARAAAEAAKQAREAVENTPLQETAEARAREIARARDANDQAIRQAEAVRDQIEKSRQATEEVARLAELARRERALARQADPAPQEQGQSQSHAKPSEDWRDRQRQVEREVNEQAQRSPEAVRDVARDQAGRARDLAAEARQRAADQQELAEAARTAPPAGAQGDPPPQPDPQSLLAQLAREQARIAGEAEAQLAEARQNQERRADRLPEAVAEASEAARQAADNRAAEAAEAARQAAELMNDLAAGTPAPSDPPESPGGLPSAGPERRDAPDPELGRLAARQQQVAEALQTMAAGKPAEAMAAAEATQAAQVAELARDVASLPESREANDALAEAGQQTRQATDHAEEAARQANQRNSPAVADRNTRAGEALGRAAEALDRAASRLDAQVAAVPPAQDPNQPQPAADAAPAAMAEAVVESAEATEAASRAEAAEAAGNAARALAEATRAAMDNLRHGPPQGLAGDQPGGDPGRNQPGQTPGDNPDDRLRAPEADPGVPPELAKLGVSASDWEKIKSMLRSNVGGASDTSVPEDYRGLVRQYFEQLAKQEKP